jgi:hypothetical protein
MGYAAPEALHAPGVSREVLKWLQSLDLSTTIVNPRRDLANGYLMAEVVARFFPADVQMHSFDNVNSMERKKNNWGILMKLFKVNWPSAPLT